MTRVDLAPPPEAELCLTRSRAASYNGGTLVDESVTDLATHVRRLADPDGYRPARCARCGLSVVHIHTYPERRPRGEAALPVVRIVQFRCAWIECRATWRVLPAFLARHLWRLWRTVERVVEPEHASSSLAPPIPETTKRRWRARAESSARAVVVVLAASGAPKLEVIAGRVGLDASRSHLVDVFAEMNGAQPGARLAPLAALAQMLERGIRVL
jgi:hypothetical protein